MKLSAYIQIVILSLFVTLLHGQKLDAPDSLSTKEKAVWYFASSSDKIYKSDDYILALEYFNKGYEIVVELENDSLVQLSKFYKGIIIASRGKAYYKDAIAIFEQAINGFDIYENIVYKSKTFNQLANINFRMKNYDEALKYYKLAYKTILTSDKPEKAITPIYSMALIYNRQLKYAKALEFANKAKKLNNDLLEGKVMSKKDSIFKYKIEYCLANSYLSLNQYDKGKNTINKAIKGFKEHDCFSLMISSYNVLKRVEIKRGDKSKALQLSDSVIKYLRVNYRHWKKKNDNYIDELKTLDNISLQLDLANKEIELKEEKNTKLTWSLSLAAILIISLFAVSILLKHKNSTLKFLKVKAEEGERQKSKFIAMISHEIRTPLNALLGFSRLLLEENPAKSQIKHLNSLISSADYLLNLVNNVLNLNDSEKGKIKIENYTIEMEAFVNNIADSFSLQISNKKNKLTVNYDPKIPKQLKSDSLKITQILKNLLNNACKFTDNGNIWLNVTLLEDNSDHCMVSFEVRDTGKGIPKAEFERIFEAFSKESLDIKKEHDGTGIGLSIVKKLLRVFDSEVSIESKVDCGSSFSFVLKMYKLSQEVRPVIKTNNYVLKGKKILVVEDNKINQILATKMLKSVEAIPEISGNGLIGLETFKSKPAGYYNLILMDLHMPVMDGYEATKLIRKIDKNIPILALTATNLNNDKDTLNEKGLNAVIHKPYQVDTIYVVMKKFITEN